MRSRPLFAAPASSFLDTVYISGSEGRTSFWKNSLIYRSLNSRFLHVKLVFLRHLLVNYGEKIFVRKFHCYFTAAPQHCNISRPAGLRPLLFPGVGGCKSFILGEALSWCKKEDVPDTDFTGYPANMKARYRICLVIYDRLSNIRLDIEYTAGYLVWPDTGYPVPYRL